MDIREETGRRITKARKMLGITIKELSDRTKILSAARISNWEHGTRSPGPEEALLLAQHLNVSASYILCLTDNPEGELRLPLDHAPRPIPLLATMDALRAREFDFTHPKTIAVDDFNKSKRSDCLFAIEVENNSMQPVFNVNDLVIVDAELSPKPGDHVLAYLHAKNQIVLRKYAEIDAGLFQLLASNDLWATVNVKQVNEVTIVGVVVEHRRFL